jgi:hypothetical protein
MAPTGTQQDSMAPTGTQQDSMAPTATRQDNMAPTGTQQDSMAPTGTQQDSMAPTGTQQDSMAAGDIMQPPPQCEMLIPYQCTMSPAFLVHCLLHSSSAHIIMPSIPPVRFGILVVVLRPWSLTALWCRDASRQHCALPWHPCPAPFMFTPLGGFFMSAVLFKGNVPNRGAAYFNELLCFKVWNLSHLSPSDA